MTGPFIFGDFTLTGELWQRWKPSLGRPNLHTLNLARPTGARSPMSVLSMIANVRFETGPARRMARRGVRWVMLLVGFALLPIGVVGAVLPTHLGAIFLVIGLALILRASYSARRTFIRVQRRHPKVVFPLRRLLRREPEVMPVAWQQILRTERAVLPRHWRVAGAARRRIVRSRRKRL